MSCRRFPAFRRAWLLCLVGVLTPASLSYAGQWTKELAPGVTLTQITKTPDDNAIPRVINILKVDPKTPGIRVQMVLGKDKVWDTDSTNGRETVGSMAKRLGAVATINGDFFPFSGDPLNLCIGGGELISEPHENRSVFGLTSDGKCLFDRLEFDAKITLPDGKWFPIRGINRPRGQNELVAFTPKFFTSTCTKPDGSEAVVKLENGPVKVGVPLKGTVSSVKSDSGDTAIADGTIVLSGWGTGSDFIKERLHEGMAVNIEFNLKPAGWENITEAVGGACRIIRDGKIAVEMEVEHVVALFVNTTHPRTAIGSTRDGKIVMVTVDGRQSISTGFPLPDLAKLMLDQGCVQAINLDGGGSSTMATSFGTINCPSDGPLRPVSDGLAVFQDQRVPDSARDFKIALPTGTVESGESVQLTLTDPDGNPLDAAVASKAVWCTNGGAGFVDQSGLFFGYKAAKGEVVARLGSNVVSVPIETIPAPACKLSAEVKADPDMPNRSVLSVALRDLNGNGVRGEITIQVTGGIPDSSPSVTGGDGKASTGITWDGTTGQVTVTSGSLKSAASQPE